METQSDIIRNIKHKKDKCPHCNFLYKLYMNDPNTTIREYEEMIEVFVYLHEGDVCNFSQETSICKDFIPKLNYTLVEYINEIIQTTKLGTSSAAKIIALSGMLADLGDNPHEVLKKKWYSHTCKEVYEKRITTEDMRDWCEYVAIHSYITVQQAEKLYPLCKIINMPQEQVICLLQNKGDLEILYDLITKQAGEA